MMRYWFLVRWVEGKAKISGHTIRQSPEDISWELILEDGRWWRFADNPLLTDTFAIEIKAPKNKAIPLAKSCFKNGKGKTIVVKPGEFGNETKAAFTFYRGIKSGTTRMYDDNELTIRLKIGRKMLVMTKREGVEGQWRVTSDYSGPGRPERKPTTFAIADLIVGKEVLRLKQDPKVRFEKVGDTWTIFGLPIAAPGVWNGFHMSEERLKSMVPLYSLVRDKNPAPLKLGHVENPGVRFATYDETGEPALGYVRNLWWDDDDKVLRADVIKVPGIVVEAIRKGAYTGISPEIEPNSDGRSDLLVAVALLGADIPAIGSLPRLLELYSKRKKTWVSPVIPLEALNHEKGGKMGEKHPMDSIMESIPHAHILFFAKAQDVDEDKLIDILHGKGYPKVLAREIIELMPDPDETKIKALPDYGPDLWEPRLEKLRERAVIPEKAKLVIDELEEFLEMHGDEISDDFKEKVNDVIAKAKETVSKSNVKVESEEEKYPVEKPSNEETYPEMPANVKVTPKMPEYPTYPKYPEHKEEAKKEEFSKLRSLLRQRSMEAIDAKIQAFAASGYDSRLLSIVRELMVELDPILTDNPDRSKIARLFMEAIKLRPVKATFSRMVSESTPPDDLASIILEAAKES